MKIKKIFPHRVFQVGQKKNNIFLKEYSSDVFKHNMLYRYIDRPNLTHAGGKYRVLEKFCFADFLSDYCLAP